MSNTKETLYDWNTAPVWAKWAATDRNGKAYWFEKKPSAISGFGYWLSNKCIYRFFAYLLPSEKWENTLEKRPQTK